MPLLPQRMNGRPYFAYVPEPLSELGAQFRASDAAFRQIDAAMAQVKRIDSDRLLAEAEIGLSSSILSGDYRCTLENEARPNPAPAIIHLARALKIDRKQLFKANAALRGMPKARFRTSPIWMSAPHSADSWYVAPPHSLVPELTRNLFDFLATSRLAISLRMAIVLIRLLQIHAFEDANGRTARACFVAMGLRAWEARSPIVAVLPRLWAQRGLRRYGTSVHMRTAEEWRPYLEFAHECFNRAVADISSEGALLSPVQRANHLA